MLWVLWADQVGTRHELIELPYHGPVMRRVNLENLLVVNWVETELKVRSGRDPAIVVGYLENELSACPFLKNVYVEICDGLMIFGQSLP
jgi:hypothetical protein